ncbi:MAG: TOBE domain-containing protein, partial [Candidatus Eisenbacteria bacterium]
THDQVEAMTLGDRIVLLKGGELQQVADPLTLYHQPANVFVAGFIGSPPINLLRALVDADGTLMLGDHRSAVGEPLRSRFGSRQGSAVTLGVRPEDFSLGDAAEAAKLTLPAIVDVCEPLGNETLVYWRTPAGPVVSRLAGSEAPSPGTRATLTAAFPAVHAFDATTERRLAD